MTKLMRIFSSHQQSALFSSTFSLPAHWIITLNIDDNIFRLKLFSFLSVPFDLCTFFLFTVCSHSFICYVRSIFKSKKFNWNTVQTHAQNGNQLLLAAFVGNGIVLSALKNSIVFVRIAFRFSLFKVYNFISEFVQWFFSSLCCSVTFSWGRGQGGRKSEQQCWKSVMFGYPNVFQDLKTVVHFVNINKPTNCIDKFEKKNSSFYTVSPSHIRFSFQLSIHWSLYEFNLESVQTSMGNFFVCPFSDLINVPKLNWLCVFVWRREKKFNLFTFPIWIEMGEHCSIYRFSVEWKL